MENEEDNTSKEIPAKVTVKYLGVTSLSLPLCHS